MRRKSLDLCVNWDRSLFIDATIDDELVRRLTPSILKLRQQSLEPITVAIDSPGGSLSSLDILLGLLTGPTQKGESGRIITVNTNHAYSAAANLLSFGNYATALNHSDILFHDVRWSGISDVTPSKARSAAKSLQEANDKFSLKLADRIINRLIWVYIDLRPQFAKAGEQFPRTLETYRAALGDYAVSVPGKTQMDIAGFATCLYAKLSVKNDNLINAIMKRLSQWVLLRGLATAFPAYREKGSRKAGLLDGIKELHKMLGGTPDDLKKAEVDLKLVLTLLTAELNNANANNRSFSGSIDDASRNFILIQSMNDIKHRQSATRLIRRNSYLYFDEKLDEVDEERKKELIAEAMPVAQLFWLFCISLCRELFEGEHTLNPNDAQLLGLIDEVAGGGLIESRREFLVKKEKEEAASQGIN